jgi:hypothetical protein
MPMHGAPMRTLGYRTHILLSLAGAAGVIFMLDRPWYAPAPSGGPTEPGIGDINGPLNSFFASFQRWFTEPVGQTGWDSLDQVGFALAAMAAAAALGALACVNPALQPFGRNLLRYGALAVLAIAGWKLFDPPGPNELLELRRGALAAVGCALVLVTSAMGVANAPLRRKLAPRAGAPRPSAYSAYGTSGSSAPPR